MAYTYKKYAESEEVKKAQEALARQESAKPAAYQSQWQSQLESTLEQILNRKTFQYDMNADALYNQYRDQYIRQGKLAMEDTMGVSAALTGGYGSSYAQQVGQQTYQGYLAGLNDKLPELYRLALSKYQQEGEDLLGRYDLLSKQESTDYGRFQDAYTAWQTERNYLADRYDTERETDYDRYTGDRAFDFDIWADAAKRASAQAEALLAVGVRPSDQLLQQADLASEYVNGILASLAAGAAAQLGSGTGGKAPAKKEARKTLAEQYAQLKAAGAPQRELDKLLNNAIGTTVAGQYISTRVATKIRDSRG